MKLRPILTGLVLTAVVGLGIVGAPRAMGGNFQKGTYQVDPNHAFAVFHVRRLPMHLTAWGRFNDVSGTIVVNEPIHTSTVEITIKADSVDTGNSKRDQHLKSADFFDTNQFPTLTFKSTKIVEEKDGLHVGGNLTVHGVTKFHTIIVTWGGECDQDGVHHLCWNSAFNFKRSDFGMNKFLDKVDDEVEITLSIDTLKNPG